MPPQRWHLPVWPFWLAGALCEAVCAPLGIEPPIYRRRVDFFTKSRAFDITRARAELGYAPHVGLREGMSRTLDLVPRAWLDLTHRADPSAMRRRPIGRRRDAQDQLFAPGKSQPRQVRRARRRTAGPRRAAEA